MPTRKSYTPPAGLSPSASENGWADTVPKTWVCIVWKDKLLFILLFIHGGGGQGGAVKATEHAGFGKRRLVLYVARLPGRATTRLRCLRQTPRLGLLRDRKSSYTLVNRSHSCGPLIFWSFDIFQLLPFPSLSFLQCHKRQKCLNNWGQRYLLAVRLLFSRHWLSARTTQNAENW